MPGGTAQGVPEDRLAGDYLYNGKGLHEDGSPGSRKASAATSAPVFPEKADRELIAKRILEELENGIVKESTLNEFQAIIRKMQEQDGIEAVVLGCTELPMILNEGNCPVAVLDSVEIHIEELIRISIGDGNQ